jgi:hypothetical protein
LLNKMEKFVRFGPPGDGQCVADLVWDSMWRDVGQRALRFKREFRASRRKQEKEGRPPGDDRGGMIARHGVRIGPSFDPKSIPLRRVMAARRSWAASPHGARMMILGPATE